MSRAFDEINALRGELAAANERVKVLDVALRHIYTEATLKYIMTFEQAAHLESVVHPLLSHVPAPQAETEGVAACGAGTWGRDEYI